MKNLFNWQARLGLLLIALSGAVYLVHYLIFRDAHHIFLYLVGDIAFVFIEVLLVTMILHRLLGIWERRSLLKKLNMVIGAFFSEAGTGLLRLFSGMGDSEFGGELILTSEWKEKDFMDAINRIKGRAFPIKAKRDDIGELKRFLSSKRDFLLRLLENPNLLEHESFTDLLWAVFHLTEELEHRKDISALPDSDLEHLSGDIKRAFEKLIVEWLIYMKYLKGDYPYLYSLAVRTNPFNPAAEAEIRGK